MKDGSMGINMAAIAHGVQGFIQDFQFGGGEFSVKFSQKFIILPKFY